MTTLNVHNLYKWTTRAALSVVELVEGHLGLSPAGLAFALSIEMRHVLLSLYFLTVGWMLTPALVSADMDCGGLSWEDQKLCIVHGSTWHAYRQEPKRTQHRTRRQAPPPRAFEPPTAEPSAHAPVPVPPTSAPVIINRPAETALAPASTAHVTPEPVDPPSARPAAPAAQPAPRTVVDHEPQIRTPPARGLKLCATNLREIRSNPRLKEYLETLQRRPLGRLGETVKVNSSGELIDPGFMCFTDLSSCGFKRFKNEMTTLRSQNDGQMFHSLGSYEAKIERICSDGETIEINSRATIMTSEWHIRILSRVRNNQLHSETTMTYGKRDDRPIRLASTYSAFPSGSGGPSYEPVRPRNSPDDIAIR